MRVDIDLDRRLDAYEWSVRTATCFDNNNLVTIRDLVRCTESGLLASPNFGAKSLVEVKQFLVDRGLRLGMDVELAGKRAEPVRGPKRRRPPCTERVKVSSIDTSTRRFREEKTRRAGVPIDQCAAPADYRVDGVLLCAAHAGRRALEILEGMS